MSCFKPCTYCCFCRESFADIIMTLSYLCYYDIIVMLVFAMLFASFDHCGAIVVLMLCMLVACISIACACVLLTACILGSPMVLFKYLILFNLEIASDKTLFPLNVDKCYIVVYMDHLFSSYILIPSDKNGYNGLLSQHNIHFSLI